MKTITLTIFSVLIFCNNPVFAQESKVLNLPEYNNQRLHFGFSIMGSTSRLLINQNAPTQLSSPNEIGFAMGIISELNLHNNFALRFVPDLSFIIRTITPIQRTDHAFINLPINIKVRTNRINNFDFYVLLGMRYTRDITKQKPGATPASIQFTKYEYAYEGGIGADYFLSYFKMSLDIKYVTGKDDILIHNSTSPASINSIIPKYWFVSLSFEG